MEAGGGGAKYPKNVFTYIVNDPWLPILGWSLSVQLSHIALHRVASEILSENLIQFLLEYFFT